MISDAILAKLCVTTVKPHVKPRIFDKRICETLDDTTESMIGAANIFGSRKVSTKTQFYPNKIGE